MNSSALQPVRPEDIEQWVYIAEESEDEPTVYESETPCPSSPSAVETMHQQPIDILFKSSAPVEEALTDTDGEGDGDGYFGDEDIIEDRIPPEKAFEVFLKCNYPIIDSNYSNSISSISYSGGESRTERFQRLVSEVNSLATQVGETDDNFNNNKDAFSQIGELKAQLRAIERQFSQVPSTQPFTIVQEDEDVENKTETEVKKEITVELVSPSVSAMVSLEKRISSLEESVGVSKLEESFTGTSISQMADDVRTRLSLVTDSDNISRRLREDAKQIAEILTNDISSQRMDDYLRLGSLVEKVHEWQCVIDAVPLLVDRFSSVRHLHSEAANFIDAASVLSNQINSIDGRSIANRTLLNTVRCTMRDNMNTINENLDALTDKLQKQQQRL